jgi:hypothetical protein
MQKGPSQHLLVGFAEFAQAPFKQAVKVDSDESSGRESALG